MAVVQMDIHLVVQIVYSVSVVSQVRFDRFQDQCAELVIARILDLLVGGKF